MPDKKADKDFHGAAAQEQQKWPLRHLTLSVNDVTSVVSTVHVALHFKALSVTVTKRNWDTQHQPGAGLRALASSNGNSSWFSSNWLWFTATPPPPHPTPYSALLSQQKRGNLLFSNCLLLTTGRSGGDVVAKVSNLRETTGKTRPPETSAGWVLGEEWNYNHGNQLHIYLTRGPEDRAQLTASFQVYPPRAWIPAATSMTQIFN